MKDIKISLAIGLTAMLGCTTNQYYGSDGEETPVVEPVIYDCTMIAERMEECGYGDSMPDYPGFIEECIKGNYLEKDSEWIECFMTNSCTYVNANQCDDKFNQSG
jgi:hypothetical protein